MFKVRLFAGDTMVEQLFFTTDNPDLLRYQAYAYGADFAPTTENGMPVAVPYSFFEGEVTLHAAHPWDHVGSVSARLTPDGPGVRSNGEDIGAFGMFSFSWPTPHPSPVVNQARFRPMPRHWPRGSSPTPTSSGPLRSR